MIIYKATFPNGKSYIGQTIYELEYRKSKHKGDYKSKNLIFYYAIRKYGWNNIIWEIIDTAETQEELNEKEKYWIKYYNTHFKAENSNGYNMTTGGEGTSGYSFEMTEETRQKMRESHKGIRPTNETRIKLSARQIGELNKSAKLTEKIVDNIKIRLVMGEKPIKISRDIHIDYSLIVHINNLESWTFASSWLNIYLEYMKPSFKRIKMSEDIAKQIKLRLVNNEEEFDLAEEFNVTIGSVRQIKNKNSWKNLLPELNEKLDNLPRTYYKKRKRTDLNK